MKKLISLIAPYVLIIFFLVVAVFIEDTPSYAEIVIFAGVVHMFIMLYNMQQDNRYLKNHAEATYKDLMNLLESQSQGIVQILKNQEELMKGRKVYINTEALAPINKDYDENLLKKIFEDNLYTSANQETPFIPDNTNRFCDKVQKSPAKEEISKEDLKAKLDKRFDTFLDSSLFKLLSTVFETEVRPNRGLINIIEPNTKVKSQFFPKSGKIRLNGEIHDNGIELLEKLYKDQMLHIGEFKIPKIPVLTFEKSHLYGDLKSAFAVEWDSKVKCLTIYGFGKNTFEKAKYYPSADILEFQGKSMKPGSALLFRRLHLDGKATTEYGKYPMPSAIAQPFRDMVKDVLGSIEEIEDCTVPPPIVDQHLFNKRNDKVN